MKIINFQFKLAIRTANRAHWLLREILCIEVWIERVSWGTKADFTKAAVGANRSSGRWRWDRGGKKLICWTVPPWGGNPRVGSSWGDNHYPWRCLGWWVQVLSRGKCWLVVLLSFQFWCWCRWGFRREIPSVCFYLLQGYSISSRQDKSSPTTIQWPIYCSCWDWR